MFSIPKRLGRPALLAVVALGTVGGSISAASAQPYGGGYGRGGDNWRHAPRYDERHAGYQHHYGQPCYRGGYGHAYRGPVYYGGYQTGYYNAPVIQGGYQGGYYPAGGYAPTGANDRQDYDTRYDNDRDDPREWRDEWGGYDEEDDD